MGTPLVLLAVPVMVDVRVSNRFDESSRVLVIALCGLVRWRPAKPGRLSSDLSAPSASRYSGALSERGLALLRREEPRARIVRFLADLWRAIDKDDVGVAVRLGLDNPADTRQLWALLGPFSALFAQLQTLQLDLKPDFSQEVFAWRVAGRVTFVPLKLLWITVVFFLSPTLWRGRADELRSDEEA